MRKLAYALEMISFVMFLIIGAISIEDLNIWMFILLIISIITGLCGKGIEKCLDDDAYDRKEATNDRRRKIG